MKPPYKITDTILHLIASVSEHIGEVKAVHLSKPPTELRKRNKIRTIHSSLEIEGNTLSLEQVTAIIENKRVTGPQRDIIEVKNAMAVYEELTKFDSCSFRDFCRAHSILMNQLVDSPGNLRAMAVGIVKDSDMAHLPPPGEMVKPLIKDLFKYLKSDPELLLIKSCVFHYELEFIHPFVDGNGRMGRLWQTVILKDKYPVFEYLPVEALIKERRTEYYEALSKSDKAGESSQFIEFMLGVFKDSLDELLKTQNINLTQSDRVRIYKSISNNTDFTRKDYLRHFKNISPATASRDLQYAVENQILQKLGDKNKARYQYI